MAGVFLYFLQKKAVAVSKSFMIFAFGLYGYTFLFLYILSLVVLPSLILCISSLLSLCHVSFYCRLFYAFSVIHVCNAEEADMKSKHARAMQGNAEFYVDWLLPVVRAYCQVKEWGQFTVKLLGTAGRPEAGREYLMPQVEL